MDCNSLQQELIREVEMGPFKHKVDDGLDIRKAAFECMYTLLDTCLDRLDIFDFLQHLQHGLWDHYDIKMLAYLMVARLAQLAPSAVLQSKHACLFISFELSCQWRKLWICYKPQKLVRDFFHEILRRGRLTLPHLKELPRIK